MPVAGHCVYCVDAFLERGTSVINENMPTGQPLLAKSSEQPESFVQPPPSKTLVEKGAAFDFSDMKRLQDNDKFAKARFNLKLYRK